MAESVDSFDQLITLYKANQGYANTNSDYGVNQESVVTRPSVLVDRVFTQTVPTNAPSDTSRDGTWSVTGVASSQRWVSAASPWIVQYRSVKLSSVDSNPEMAFNFARTMGGSSVSAGTNLLTNMLLPKMSAATTTPYTITISTDASGSNVISSANYVLDRDAGLIVFSPGNGVSSGSPPYISFWRYEGLTLQSVINSDGNLSASSNTIAVSNGLVTVNGQFTVNNANGGAKSLTTTYNPGNNQGFIQVGDPSGTSLNITGSLAQNGNCDILTSASGGGGSITIGANGYNSTNNIVVSSGLTTFKQNVLTMGLLDVSGAATMKSGLTISSGGLAVTGSATMNSGLSVAAGSLDVSGAATMRSGLTVSSGGLAVTGVATMNSGLSVAAGGLSVTGGATMNSGLTVAGGLAVTGGISTNSAIVPTYSGTAISIGQLYGGKTATLTFPSLPAGLYSLTIQTGTANAQGDWQSHISTMFYWNGSEIVSGGSAVSDSMGAPGAIISIVPKPGDFSKLNVTNTAPSNGAAPSLTANIIQLLGAVTFSSGGSVSIL